MEFYLAGDFLGRVVAFNAVRVSDDSDHGFIFYKSFG